MLASLSIKNYALIDHLEVTFQEGFSIITGETGAGKSILLGALALILGKRADLSNLKNKEKKCIIEGGFLIDKFNLNTFFEANDIDFEEHTIIRREILPNGKSRAFINDTPVKLSVLTALSDQLIDVHSQHQTLQLADVTFQFLIIDALANNANTINSYKKELIEYKNLTNELQEILTQQNEAKNQYDYNTFLLNELLEADFKLNEQQFLEETLEKLNHVEEIKFHLIEAQQLADSEEIGLTELLRKYSNVINKLSGFSIIYKELSERITSLLIDFEDISQELIATNDALAYSPQDLEKYNDRLQLLYDVQKKHQVTTIEELIEKQELLNNKVGVVDNANEVIEAKKIKISTIENKLNSLAETIHKNRKKAIPLLINQLEDVLKGLEMHNTSIKINLSKKDEFLANGKNELEFLISTNKGSSYEQLKKIASGGEMSRIMLAVKSILCNYSDLPTIIFDEIDTGVSGEVSNRIAAVMENMSKKMQVIAITHLPQIAAKGKHHFKVFKTEGEKETIANIKLLNFSERVQELAEILSGKKVSNSAIIHAKQLLNMS
ncbi:MAG TPA: DNA repair protein RecN [Flavobacteriaceae bacterium]|jgi:DNA repair protein RecN (Recombination protein N)|nr:DNA repair protein RecN [Flavobacteriaceae bacterium]HBS12597.1 DNA repair protein RecN [Flavobacteriaceae bacterium]